MTATTPHFDTIFDSQATFRVALEAMARPGSLARLPAIDPRCPLAECRPLAALLLTLLDHEVSFAVVPAAGDGAAAEALARHLALSTGSRPAPLDEADYVLALGPPLAELLPALKRGLPAYPDTGATLLLLTPSLALPEGPTVALAGPGVRPGTSARLTGLTAADLALQAEVNADPPLGIDLILADPDGYLLCLPRSTTVTLDE